MCKDWPNNEANVCKSWCHYQALAIALQILQMLLQGTSSNTAGSQSWPAPQGPQKTRSTSSTLGLPLQNTLDQKEGSNQLMTALSNMASMQPPIPFANKFVLTSDMEYGGQAVVVFAQRVDSRMRHYAIKYAFAPCSRSPRTQSTSCMATYTFLGNIVYCPTNYLLCRLCNPQHHADN
jgi:hypothetical protein